MIAFSIVDYDFNYMVPSNKIELEKKFKIASAAAKKSVGLKKEETMTESKKPEMQEEVIVNDALKNSLTYQPEERIMRDAFNQRER